MELAMFKISFIHSAVENVLVNVRGVGNPTKTSSSYVSSS